MKVYLINATCGSYDDMEEKVVGVFLTLEKAEAAQKVFDEKYATLDYYERIFTGIQEMDADVLREW